MKLGRKQRKFTLRIGRLIRYAYAQGYELTFGDAYRSKAVKYGHKDSTHRVRLAVDFNLFIDGVYISDGEHPAFADLHDRWDELGGSERILKDMNHFSFEHNGVR